MEFRPLTPMLHELAEGPVWVPGEMALYFVDIPAFRIHRYDWATAHLQSWRAPSEPGSLAPSGDGNLIVALRDGFYLFRPQANRFDVLARPGYDTTSMRMNDGRCDPVGRFWAGTMDVTRSGPNGGLWCMDRTALRKGPDGVVISNGLAFSPDGRTMYHADSIARVVYRFEYDLGSGRASGREVWFRCPDGLGDPDGASVDRHGNYWIAMYGGGCILKISPHGELLATVEVPAKYPTMVTFAGPALDHIVVTSSRRNRPADELARYPSAGGVFVSGPTSTVGIAEVPFQL